MDEGITSIEDAAELAAVRAQARRVHVRSGVVAVVLTLIALVAG